MLKTKLIIVSFLLSLLILPGSKLVLGVDTPATTGGRFQQQNELKQLRTDFKASASALREDFKRQLQTIRDQKKRLIIERFADKMNRVNSRRVAHWQKILARLSSILDRIKTKEDQLDSQGKDTTELEAAIASASAKLLLAQTAVDAQGDKVYTVNIASESALKVNAGAAMTAEQADLRNVLKTVQDARKSIFDALKILKQMFGGPLPKVATSSGTPATGSGGTP